MINKNLLKSIFLNYHISKVVLVEDKTSYNFVICEMNSSLSLNRWTDLENILKHQLKKDIDLLPYNQVVKHFGKDYLKKGVIIGE